MTAADQPTTKPSVLGTDRDTLARLIARAQDADAFYDDIQAWESQEDWEREAHPDNYPDMAYEDLTEYQNIADRVLSDLSRLAPAPQPAADTEHEVQWGVRYGLYIESTYSEASARAKAKGHVHFDGGTPPVVIARTVTRTVTKTRWEEA